MHEPPPANPVAITLPDGAVRRFDRPVTGAEIAASIASSLAKAALAVKVDGKILDLDLPITQDAAVEIVTRRSPEALELIRHDAAHVMAEAVQELWIEPETGLLAAEYCDGAVAMPYISGYAPPPSQQCADTRNAFEKAADWFKGVVK